MQYKWSILFTVILLFCLTGCDEIIEIDISREQVMLLTPADSLKTDKLAQTFRWTPLKGARAYNLQIASPSLKSPGIFFVDTTVTKEFLTLTLQPGKFEWRIKAINGGYETAIQSRIFQIDSSANLANQELVLRAPANNGLINLRVINFSWDGLPMADEYIFKLTASGSTYDTTVTTKVPRLQVKIPGTAHSYQWKVTALNTASAKISATYEFSTDYTAPAAPGLTNPSTDTSFQTYPVVFRWRRNGSDIKQDSLFVFNSDQQTRLTGFPIAVNSQFHVFNSQSSFPAGTYYWGIKSVDKANNSSILSGLRKFSVR